MKDFKGKVAVITGAASGIGYGLAERCAKEGMKVVLAGINEDTLKKAEKEIKKTGATILVVKTDVSKAGDVENLAKKTIDAFGAVHLLFNNAGFGILSTMWESTLNDWQWILGVDLWGVIHGVHFFVPIMIEQKTECYIVNTAGAAGFIAPPYSPYAVAKHGVVVLSEMLYRELGLRGHNIGVSVLCPGFTITKALDAERNRPAELKNAPGEGATGTTDPNIKAMIEFMQQTLDKGMPPSQLADIVFSAIKEKKFYIMPSFEESRLNIKIRMEDILEQRNPAIAPVNPKRGGGR
jgi:NAD(P)-dependent dehydrogenase (short-subunit alcohol dehydrogenase family)